MQAGYPEPIPVRIIDHQLHSASSSTMRTIHQKRCHVSLVPLVTAGLPEIRCSPDDDLKGVGHGEPIQATASRLTDFINLFAFRYTNGIITKQGQGPRSWTKLRGPMTRKHVIRHLMGDRTSTWVGVRCFGWTRHFVIEVDQDRNDPRTLSLKELRRSCGKIPPMPTTPMFPERRRLVERALRRMGINPADPRQVLTLRSPSGGRHYYVFLDDLYHIDQIHTLLNAAGLSHTPGQIEIFPSQSHALRLPFFYIPGLPFNSTAWIQFIDDYRERVIRRFSLKRLYDKLSKNRNPRRRQHASVKTKRLLHPQRTPSRMAQYLGPTKQDRLAIKRQSRETSQPNRYLDLVTTPIQSLAEADELMKLGIQANGTRTEALKRLAANQIWFRHRSAAKAAEILTSWAMNARHESKDIAEDLHKGTTKVANQIANMCKWYEAKKQTRANSKLKPITGSFADQELEALARSLTNLAEPDRELQAHFLLHFLAFAKKHGTPRADQLGFDASPAVRPIIRRWHQCDHMKYKSRIDRALAAGILTKVEEKWQRNNRQGKARTFRIHVPVVAETEATLNYDAALDRLLDKARIDSAVGKRESNLISDLTQSEATLHGIAASTREPDCLNSGHLSAEKGQSSSNEYFAGSNDSATLRQANLHNDLAAGPRQCEIEQHAAAVVLGDRPQSVATGRTNRSNRSCSANAAGDRPEPITKDSFDEFLEAETRRIC